MAREERCCHYEHKAVYELVIFDVKTIRKEKEQIKNKKFNTLILNIKNVNVSRKNVEIFQTR